MKLPKTARVEANGTEREGYFQTGCCFHGSGLSKRSMAKNLHCRTHSPAVSELYYGAWENTSTSPSSCCQIFNQSCPLVKPRWRQTVEEPLMWSTEQVRKQPEKASGHLTASPVFLVTSLPQLLNTSCTETDHTTCFPV